MSLCSSDLSSNWDGLLLEALEKVGNRESLGLLFKDVLREVKTFIYFAKSRLYIARVPSLFSFYQRNKLAGISLTFSSSNHYPFREPKQLRIDFSPKPHFYL